jgi:hypothetical protein
MERVLVVNGSLALGTAAERPDGPSHEEVVDRHKVILRSCVVPWAIRGHLPGRCAPDYCTAF